MSKALWKDTFREIKKSKGRFLSIAMIVALGVAFFAGISAAPNDMRYSADQYFDQQNLMDLQIYSPLPFTQEDVDKIKTIEEVDSIFATTSKDVIVSQNNQQYTIRLHALDPQPETNKKINQPILVEGRLPEKSGECVMEVGSLHQLPFQIGDQIQVESGQIKAVTQDLKTDTFTIVGTIKSPYYLSHEKGTSRIGSGKIDSFFMILQEDLKQPTFQEVYLTIDKAKDFNTYDDAYFNHIAEAKDKIIALGKQQMQNKLALLQMQSLPQLEQIDPNWIVLDRNSHYSYVDYGSVATRMEGIAKVFPVFFFLVAALVCLTSMTRMVDEQRGYIGTMKALGYGKKAIARKFLCYGAIASMIGSVIGCVIGMWLFPLVIFYAWSLMYSVPKIAYDPQLFLAILASASVIGVCLLASYAAVYKELLESPANLMRPKAAKAGKKILLEQIPCIWRHLSFTMKVTMRNLFRYKKRFFMTIIGVSGCSALLVSGFGIQDSISQVVDKQYGEIFQYNMTIQLEKNVTSEEKQQVLQMIQDQPQIQLTTSIKQEMVHIDTEKMQDTATIVVPEDANSFSHFVKFNWKQDQQGSMKEGVILTEKLAKELQVKVNDMIKVKDKNQKEYSLKVNGIIENYIGHYIYMDDMYYQTIFNQPIQQENIIVKTQPLTLEQESQLGSIMMGQKHIQSVSFFSGIANNFAKTIDSLSLVVVVMVIAAALLAFVVLYNLTTVNISERLREIATIKVLGFYDREVATYVYRENLFLTIIGSVIGLGLGKFLHELIMELAEMNQVMFARTIEAKSYLFSFLLTLVFSGIVNLVMMKKLKNIHMVESLKSVE